MKRSYMKRVGARGARRRVEWETAKAAHFAEHPTCQAPEYGLETECYGVRDCHHLRPRGMGGGQDYNEYATLCRFHHQWVETHRKESYDLGILKHWWDDGDVGE